MHRVVFVVLLSLAVLTVAASAPVFAQRAAPVVVTNTNANPVPVTGTVTSTVSGTINANITNSPSVNISSMPPVTLGSVSTEKIFDASLPANGLTGTIDVGSYKQIRIVGRCFDPGGSMTVRPFVVYGDNADFDVAALDDLNVPCNTGASATYEVPGQTIRLHVPAGSGRIVIYGRPN